METRLAQFCQLAFTPMLFRFIRSFFSLNNEILNLNNFFLCYPESRIIRARYAENSFKGTFFTKIVLGILDFLRVRMVR